MSEPADGGGPSREPRQASLRRLRRFAVRPNRELGQNFLIDDNILRLIGDAAELTRDDVVLEVGGGLGVLSEYLAVRAAHVHVVEVDRSLEPPLAEALAPFENASLHLADAVKLDLAGLDPPPSKVVANLPYGVAATVLLRTVAALPDARLWVAMVQREVAERLAASPGTKSYGATSVLVQLSCEVRLLRKVPRTVFHPVPNVDSALLRLQRTGAAPSLGLTTLVHAGFAHRRKALAGSLALFPDAPAGVRDATRAALERLGHQADARAERLTPADWPRLAELLGDKAPRAGLADAGAAPGAGASQGGQLDESASPGAHVPQDGPPDPGAPPGADAPQAGSAGAGAPPAPKLPEGGPPTDP